MLTDMFSPLPFGCETESVSCIPEIPVILKCLHCLHISIIKKKKYNSEILVNWIIIMIFFYNKRSSMVWPMACSLQGF